MVVTVLRLKRKAEVPAEQRLLVKGLLPDKRKRTALDEEFSRLDVGHIKCETQYFVHMKTVPSSEYYKEDCQAPGLEEPEGDQRLRSSMADDDRQIAASQAATTCGVAPELMEEVRTYDVSRQGTEGVAAGSTSSWTATRVSPDDDGLAPDTREGPAGEYVYDIYALREGQGTSDSLWDTAPEVQMLYDGGGFGEESDDEVQDIDSEDSNAEMHYTHEYPDEEDLLSTDEETDEYDSEAECY